MITESTALGGILLGLGSAPLLLENRRRQDPSDKTKGRSDKSAAWLWSRRRLVTPCLANLSNAGAFKAETAVWSSGWEEWASPASSLLLVMKPWQNDAIEGVESTDEACVNPPTSRYSIPGEYLPPAGPSHPGNRPSTFRASDRWLRIEEMPGGGRPSEDSDLASLENDLMADSIAGNWACRSNTCIIKLLYLYEYLNTSHLHTTSYLSPLKRSSISWETTIRTPRRRRWPSKHWG